METKRPNTTKKYHAKETYESFRYPHVVKNRPDATNNKRTVLRSSIILNIALSRLLRLTLKTALENYLQTGS